MANSSAHMSKFVLGVLKKMVKEYKMAMLIEDMDISNWWHMLNRLKKKSWRGRLQGPKGQERMLVTKLTLDVVVVMVVILILTKVL